MLDTYLSPSEYTGWSIGVWHRTERKARWGSRRVTVQGHFGGNASYLSVKPDEGKAWDGFLTASGGCHYNWYPSSTTRIALGGMCEGGLGFTYLLKGGNNPAQGRLSFKTLLSCIAEQQFRLFCHIWRARFQLEVPLIGAMFTPNYGQSYYEIFSLGHADRNIRMIHPFNAPSARCLVVVDIPLGGATLNVGYLGDARQSHVNHLKHHAWNNYVLIGYTRKLTLLR